MRRRWVPVVAVVAVAFGTIAWTDPYPWTPDRASADAKSTCAYAGAQISALEGFERLAGQTVTCTIVFNTASNGWADWISPWFTHASGAGSDWAGWTRAGAGRFLVITQPLIPSARPADWARRGARGDYDPYARDLALNLVAAGLGHSIVRLGAEANNPGQPDSLGSSPEAMADWRTYWARIVTAMRSVPGSHFEFDWTVNAGYRAVPLDLYYPGDRVVDIIGIDSYDQSAAHRTYATAEQRWDALYSQPSGLAEVIAFAAARGRPLSLPEWGLLTTAMWGGGDDPRYIDGIAEVVRDQVVRYQSYFLAPSRGVLPASATPRALAAYRADFGSS